MVFLLARKTHSGHGGYAHGKQAGVLHVADRHVAPGKKFFEWGYGPEGEMWTKILTDDDGPYLELMAGAWSDNQPDYSWIQPGETREWKHWWYPIRDLGGVKAATRDAAVNLELTNRTAKIAVNATKELKGANVRLALRSKGHESAPSSTRALLDQSVDLSPAKPFAATVALEGKVSPEDLVLVVSDAKGATVIAYPIIHPTGIGDPGTAPDWFALYPIFMKLSKGIFRAVFLGFHRRITDMDAKKRCEKVASVTSLIR